MTYSNIPAQHQALTRRIDDIMQHSPLAPERITLLAVTKMQPPEKVDTLLALGHRYFAENRMQEALERWEERKNLYQDIILHYIGPLQTNKVRDAVRLFNVIETLDREKLAHAINKEAAALNIVMPCYIQINIGDEPQKTGILPEALPEFLALCEGLHNLRIDGLMCIPPADRPSAPYFALMRKLQQRHTLPYLSMGMSADYETAIRFGATHIRLGTILLGARQSR